MFFAVIGAQVDLRGINLNVLLIAGIIVAIAISTKLLGCGHYPSIIFLKDKAKSMREGIEMITRGKVGTDCCWFWGSAVPLSTDVYTAIIIMVESTTIITPICLKKVYQKELSTPSTK